MEENKKLICSRCNEELTMANANFSYLKHSFHTEVLRCPKCGQIFIPEQLARVRMREVEATIEDK